MSGSLKLIVALAAAAGSAAVLATLRLTPLDVAAGLVLVVALAVLARTAIRAAADPGGKRRPGRP